VSDFTASRSVASYIPIDHRKRVKGDIMRARRFVTALVTATLAASILSLAADPSAAAVRRRGPRLAYVAFNQASQRYELHVVERTGGGNRRLVETPCCIGDLSWSPDGLAIAYDNLNQLAGEIRIITADGRRNERIVSSPVVHGPVWSPDGGRIAYEQFVPLIPVGPGFYGENHIMVANRDGSETRPITAGSAYSPSWSPDGTRLVYENANGIYVAPVDGAAVPTRISPLGVLAVLPVWAPTGDRIAFIAQTASETASLSIEYPIYVATADGKTVRKIGAASIAWGLSWSPDGRRIVYAANGLSLVDVATGRVRRLVSGKAYAPQWSPDGRDIAFLRDDALMVVRSNGSSLRTIARNVSHSVVWSRR
jgi:Tol biopolymer transport system component